MANKDRILSRPGGTLALGLCLALAGCSGANATTLVIYVTPAPTLTPWIIYVTPAPTPTPAPTATPTPTTVVKPPAAPTGLHEWVDESSDPVPAHFAWTPPSGPIGGYYFWKKGVYVGMTPPPAICGPSWEKLPATATTYTIDAVQAEPDAYICAFNDAGTSPTVHFTQDTPLVSTPT